VNRRATIAILVVLGVAIVFVAWPSANEPSRHHASGSGVSSADDEDDNDELDEIVAAATAPPRNPDLVAQAEAPGFDPWDPPPIDPNHPRLPDIADTDDDAPPDFMQLQHEMHEALAAARPAFKKCYTDSHPAAPRLEVFVRLRLETDPDIGTKIVVQPTTDYFGEPVPAALDDCMRKVIVNLDLPSTNDRYFSFSQAIVLTTD
jgi:hypothetical protein